VKFWNKRGGKVGKKKDMESEGGQCGVSLIISFGLEQTLDEWR
jgi:hypothetical protein